MNKNQNPIYFRSDRLLEELGFFSDFLRESYGDIHIYYMTVDDKSAFVMSDKCNLDVLQILDRLMQQGDKNILRNATLIDCLTCGCMHVKFNLMCELFRRGTMKEKEEQEVYTYIIRDNSTGLFKIGKTKSLSRRFSELSCGNPHLGLAGFTDKDIEKELHLKYTGQKVKREWYRLSKEDIKSIKSKYRFIIMI